MTVTESSVFSFYDPHTQPIEKTSKNDLLVGASSPIGGQTSPNETITVMGAPAAWNPVPIEVPFGDGSGGGSGDGGPVDLDPFDPSPPGWNATNGFDTPDGPIELATYAVKDRHMRVTGNNHRAVGRNGYGADVDGHQAGGGALVLDAHVAGRGVEAGVTVMVPAQTMDKLTPHLGDFLDRLGNDFLQVLERNIDVHHNAHPESKFQQLQPAIQPFDDDVSGRVNSEAIAQDFLNFVASEVGAYAGGITGSFDPNTKNILAHTSQHAAAPSSVASQADQHAVITGHL